MRMHPLKQILLHIFVIMFMILLIFPMVLLLFNSFKSEAEIFAAPMGVPKSITFNNYAKVLTQSTFLINFKNSALVAFATVFLSMIVSAPAGYALSRFKFRGRTLFSVWLLATQSFPGIIMVLGLFVMLRTYHLLNTLPGLIVMYTSFSMPFSIWLLKGYFDKIPVALEEAARIDGCSRALSLL